MGHRSRDDATPRPTRWIAPSAGRCRPARPSTAWRSASRWTTRMTIREIASSIGPHAVQRMPAGQRADAADGRRDHGAGLAPGHREGAGRRRAAARICASCCSTWRRRPTRPFRRYQHRLRRQAGLAGGRGRQAAVSPGQVHRLGFRRPGGAAPSPEVRRLAAAEAQG